MNPKLDIRENRRSAKPWNHCLSLSRSTPTSDFRVNARHKASLCSLVLFLSPRSVRFPENQSHWIAQPLRWSARRWATCYKGSVHKSLWERNYVICEIIQKPVKRYSDPPKAIPSQGTLQSRDSNIFKSTLQPCQTKALEIRFLALFSPYMKRYQSNTPEWSKCGLESADPLSYHVRIISAVPVEAATEL